MRKIAWIGTLFLLASLSAVAADEFPKFEVFGGVSWLHIDTMRSPGLKSNYAGWDTEAQFNFRRYLGLTADIGGNYGRIIPGADTSHSYAFVFGPTFSYRGQHGVVFAHVLFGEHTYNIMNNALNTSPATSDSAFAMAWGGGYDVKVNKTFAIRLGQLDWLYTRHNFVSSGKRDLQNNLRYAGGVVINFGD